MPIRVTVSESDADIYELVSPDSAATAHVPTDDSLGMTWTEPGFDDAAWMSGTSGVGFEVLSPPYELNESFDNPLGDDWTVDIPAEGLGTVSVTSGVLRFSIPADQDFDAVNRGKAPMVYRALPVPSTDYEITTRITQGINDKGAQESSSLTATPVCPRFESNTRARRGFV